MRRGQGKFADLAHARLSLRHGPLGRDDIGVRFVVIQPHQHVAGVPGLAFDHRDFGDNADDLAANVDAVGRLDMAGGDDGLQVVGAIDRVDKDAWAEQQGRREVGDGGQHGEQRRSVIPPAPGSREVFGAGASGALERTAAEPQE